MMDFVEEILFNEEDLKAICKRLGEQISKDYEGRKLVLIGMLKGAILFMADLIREIKIPCNIDFMEASSYVGTQTSGIVKINKDLRNDIAGWDVLIIEDILESGFTLDYVVKLLKERNPNSLKICTLLDKPESRKIKSIQADYVGAKIPKDKFVIGYGFDYNERYRNLPFVGVLDSKYAE